jgi:hypothetical protein
MKILCHNCRHKTVCRFEQSYRDTVDNLNEKIPTPFNLELKCPHHDGETHALYRGTCCSVDGLTTTSAADYESLTAKSITSSIKG